MSKFRKKPVVIEAVQLRWDTWGEMCEHVDVGDPASDRPTGCYVNSDGEGVTDYPGGEARIGLWIPTLEGLRLATEGDYVIRGVQGELYPCKPDIFDATYEPVED